MSSERTTTLPLCVAHTRQCCTCLSTAHMCALGAYRVGQDACARLVCFGSQFVCLDQLVAVHFVAVVRPTRSGPWLATRSTDRIWSWYPVGSSPTLRAQTTMSTPNVDSNTLSTADISDPLVPIYTDKTPIIWDGNYAHIEGLLYEVGRFYKRMANSKCYSSIAP